MTPEEIQKEFNELEEIRKELERRFKENRIELYNVGKTHLKQIDFHRSGKRVRAIFGGNRCIAGESLVYDPVLKGYREVQKIDSDFHVYAWDGEKYVVAKALKPFHHEDKDDLYDFTLSNGEKFTASMNHRVYCADGFYRQLSQCLEQCGLFHHPTSLACDPLIQISDAPHSKKITEGSRSGYRRVFHLCGGLPRFYLNNGRDVSPSRVYAQKPLSYGVSLNEDGLCSRHKCNLVYQRHDHLSSSGVLQRFLDRTFGLLFRSFDIFLRHFDLRNRFDLQPIYGCDLQPQPIVGFEQSVHQTDLKHCTSTFDITPLFVISISHNRKDYKWDFTVPEYENYYMSGIIHHNTGKTVAGAVEAVLHALGDKRYRNLEPSSGWVVSLTSDVQKEVAQKEILKWIPKKEISNIIVRHGRKDDLEGSLIEKIVLKNGCYIGFKTCEQGRESFQGASLGWVWFDEEPPADIYKECLMRLMDTRGDMWFTMTPLKGLTWIYNLIYVNENNNTNVEYFMFEWEDNPFLSKEEIQEMILNMPEEEREARQYGRFTSVCGFAFNELSKEVHIKKAEIVPEWYKRYVSLDYGFDSLAVMWYWVDRFGRARVYRALRKKNLIISEAAKEILKFTGQEKIESFYAPPDLWNRRQDTGKSAAQIFWENGISLYKTSNNREQGWLNVHEWFKPYETKDEQTGKTYKIANLTFDEGIDPDVWKHLTTIQKSDKNINDVSSVPHELTHYPDCLRCFCVSRMRASKEPDRPINTFLHREEPDTFFGTAPDSSFFY